MLGPHILLLTVGSLETTETEVIHEVKDLEFSLHVSQGVDLSLVFILVAEVLILLVHLEREMHLHTGVGVLEEVDLVVDDVQGDLTGVDFNHVEITISYYFLVGLEMQFEMFVNYYYIVSVSQ